jgi:hypothetical protein
MICPEDIPVPIDVRNVKELKVTSVLMILFKLLEESGKLNENEAK